MGKINCWEYKQCGREEGGKNVAKLGICPASSYTAADGLCGGKNGGRSCSYITGTFCGGMLQGTYKDKRKGCGTCAFFNEVKAEHGREISVISFFKYVKAHN